MTVRDVQAQHGFSLIELMVVMALLGLLSALIAPLAEMTVRRDREKELKLALWEIRAAIDEYQRFTTAAASQLPSSRSPYPPSLTALAEGVPDPNAAGQRKYFLRRVPRDPFADAALAPEATWALRSYASPPERPVPGDDVYDVASRSTLIGLNGVPLSQW